MKYMIMLYGSQQDYAAMSGKPSARPAWSAEDLQKMFEFMDDVNKELVAKGEMAEGHGLAEPAQTRRVQLVDGAPVVTDGPYPETKEVVAGYWVVDVDGLERATEIAAHIATCPGPGGAPDTQPIDIRPVLDEAPSLEG